MYGIYFDYFQPVKTIIAKYLSFEGSKDMVFRVEDFDGLGNVPFIEKMMQEICREDCTTIVDLCFLMDASGSIDK